MSGSSRMSAQFWQTNAWDINSVLTTTHDDRTVTLYATVEVEGIGERSTILQKLEGVREVNEVRRETNTGCGSARPPS